MQSLCLSYVFNSFIQFSGRYLLFRRVLPLFREFHSGRLFLLYRCGMLGRIRILRHVLAYNHRNFDSNVTLLVRLRNLNDKPMPSARLLPASVPAPLPSALSAAVSPTVSSALSSPVPTTVRKRLSQKAAEVRKVRR
jgi:hypothetical protein